MSLAIVLLVVILEVVRRRRLSENYALLWLGVGVMGVLLGLARPLVDRLSSAIGIVYGTSLVFALAFVFLLIVCINLTVHVSRLEERVEVLAQEVALLSSDDAEPPALGSSGGPATRSDESPEPPGQPSS
nr:DUF2304 domain-containing protein [Rhabdothermincola salaria]